MRLRNMISHTAARAPRPARRLPRYHEGCTCDVNPLSLMRSVVVHGDGGGFRLMRAADSPPLLAVARSRTAQLVVGRCDLGRTRCGAKSLRDLRLLSVADVRSGSDHCNSRRSARRLHRRWLGRSGQCPLGSHPLPASHGYSAFHEKSNPTRKPSTVVSRLAVPTKWLRARRAAAPEPVCSE